MGLLFLSRGTFWMVWRYHGISCFHFYFFVKKYCKKENFDENNFHQCYRNFFGSPVLKVTWSELCSKFFLNNYEAHYWQRHLRDTLQLKILRPWIHIRANSFLIKHPETKNWRKCLENCNKIQDDISLIIYGSFSFKQN